MAIMWKKSWPVCRFFYNICHGLAEENYEKLKLGQELNTRLCGYEAEVLSVQF
jgi:hypothetical protein